MDTSATVPACFIGCDVGKAEIVVYDSRTERITRVRNDAPALFDFALALDPDALVICEPTGGYEAPLLDALIRAGRAAHRADARKVKAFIRSLGILGKNDAIDAKALAHYGRERHHRLPRWLPRERQRDRLTRLVSIRHDLVEQRVACRNRLHAPGIGDLAGRLHRILGVLDAEIAGIEADMQLLVAACDPLRKTVAVLSAITGIGALTAIRLAALMPELGTLGRRQAAALAGLAPHPRQSGARDAYRATRGGRPGVKHTLFMAALTAARRNAHLAAFYRRLIANGKKPIVAIVAVMRKLIVIANAKLRDAAIV
jgi:transposase